MARTDHSSLAPSHCFYFSAGNGNITALLNANQVLVAKYLYDSYGNLISSGGPMAELNLYRFSSKEVHPSSGLVYFGRRFYDPNLQRWLNHDPIGVKGGMNLYSYAGNNTITGYDSLGEFAVFSASLTRGRNHHSWIINITANMNLLWYYSPQNKNIMGTFSPSDLVSVATRLWKQSKLKTPYSLGDDEIKYSFNLTINSYVQKYANDFPDTWSDGTWNEVILARTKKEMQALIPANCPVSVEADSDFQSAEVACGNLMFLLPQFFKTSSKTRDAKYWSEVGFAHEIGHLLGHYDAYDTTGDRRPYVGWKNNLMSDVAIFLDYRNFDHLIWQNNNQLFDLWQGLTETNPKFVDPLANPEIDTSIPR